MHVLLIPIAPLFRTKTRLKDCFSKPQLKKLTIAMFNDLGNTLKMVKCFDEKIVYCSNSEILDLAEEFNLVGIKENLTEPRKYFKDVIMDLNDIAINEFAAKSTVFTFLDIILIATKNFNEISSLVKKSQLVVCPAIHSAGISVFGRNPPKIISSDCFSDLRNPSFVSLLNQANDLGIKNISIYDSFRASFDVDIKQDLLLAHKYLKVFNLTHTETYKFLQENLKLTLTKVNIKDNRKFEITKIN